MDVIVKRYVEQIGSSKDVFVIRDGEKIAYEDIEPVSENISADMHI